MARNIGLDVEEPKESCNSEECPFHGNLKIRGKTYTGEVVSLKAKDTVVIEKRYLYYVPKYERYERRRRKIIAHMPKCLKLSKGDEIRIAECKPITKTKRHVVIEKIR
ncbi:MAG: 30S ribosomal protein S17 [Candidatus Aenigmarchaeota archaeon]|nr:30S ribosomal protein S17 [Candidatus Aenigmarchaeota archaeon]